MNVITMWLVFNLVIQNGHIIVIVKQVLTYKCITYQVTTNSHVKFHQPGPSSLLTLDLNANVNAKMSKSFRQKQQVTVTYICVQCFQPSTTNSHVKFHQPGPSSLSTLDLNANVNIGCRRRRTSDDISSLPVLCTGKPIAVFQLQYTTVFALLDISESKYSWKPEFVLSFNMDWHMIWQIQNITFLAQFNKSSARATTYSPLELVFWKGEYFCLFLKACVVSVTLLSGCVLCSLQGTMLKVYNVLVNSHLYQ